MTSKQDGQFYCLQPVVVRQKSEPFILEVIDRQQRLTTIAILLQYLNRPSYTLDYETRPLSRQVLAGLRNDTSESVNVNQHYFKQAYQTISEWFDSNGISHPDLLNDFYSTLL